MGALQINGPTTANYDVDLGPYFVNDWYYRTAFLVNEITSYNLQSNSPPPPADNILINGTNKNAAGGGTYAKTTLQKGKKYLLRLVNPSVDNYIRVSLDQHPFTVVTSDLVPIHPYTTDWLLIGIGNNLARSIKCLRVKF